MLTNRKKFVVARSAIYLLNIGPQAKSLAIPDIDIFFLI
jgi:hypothetical protein